MEPDWLERLRRGVALRMTATGRFEIGGEPVTHARLDHALRSGLDVTDGGEPTVHLGAQWCYLGIDDLPLRATGVTNDDGILLLRLDDGRTLPLDPVTLWEEPGHGLRATVPSAISGRPLGVRFTNQAQMDLSAWIEPDGARSVLVFSGRRHAIPPHPPQR